MLITALVLSRRAAERLSESSLRGSGTRSEQYNPLKSSFSFGQSDTSVRKASLGPRAVRVVAGLGGIKVTVPTFQQGRGSPLPTEPSRAGVWGGC